MKKLIPLFMFLLLSLTLDATIIHIPQDFTTIQTGIDSSNDGDTVIVDTGRYVENINFNGKKITLASNYLNTNDTTYISQTIIDGNQYDHVVEFSSEEDTSSVLIGFTITNGNSLSGWQGGGIYCYNSSPKLENLSVSENYTDADNRGGGINCWFQASPLIRDVVIENNSAGKGGGLFCNDYSSPVLTNVIIKNNSTLGYYADGGGVCLISDCQPVFENISIINNTLSSQGGAGGAGMACLLSSHPILHNVIIQNNSSIANDCMGGGIYAYHSNPILDSVIIANNNLLGYNSNGGGVYHQYQIRSQEELNLSDNKQFPTISQNKFNNRIPNFSLDNVTIRDNYAQKNGGGIYLSYLSEADLENVVIKDNNVGGFEGGGGGVYCTDNSSPTMKDVIIKNNIVTEFSGRGGGIYCTKNSVITLKNVTIKYNNAFSGGGIFNGVNSNIIFSAEFLSNIYFNNIKNSFKGAGTDLFSNNFMEVVVDTFSLQNPTDYYAFPLSNYSFNINHGMFQQVNSDLYVSPSGDNSNHGLTPDEPLKTIHYAIYLIKADSSNSNTIHLTEGLYSPSNNDEYFPLIPKNHISILGASRENVIIDAENTSNVFYCNNLNEAVISQLTISGGSSTGDGGGIYCNESNLTITDIDIINNNADISGGGVYAENSSLVIDDLNISDNNANSKGGGIYLYDCDLVTNGLIISNNSSEYGGAIYCDDFHSRLQNMEIFANSTNELGTIYLNNSECDLYNLLMYDNVSYVGATICAWDSNPTLVNLTISNNINNTGSAIFGQSSTLNLFNTITTSNSGNFGGIFIGSGDAVIEYCNFYNNENVNYYNCSPGTGCIEADPLFADSVNGDYSLTVNSPCIDSGTPDTIGLNMPFFDLKGNVRIWDGNDDGISRIDMGAYEYDAPVYAVDQPEIIAEKIILNYPNPAVEHTTFKYSLKNNSRVTLKIYNVKGQLVETLVNETKQKGKHTYNYDTVSLKPGIYFYQLKSNEATFTRKMLTVK